MYISKNTRDVMCESVNGDMETVRRFGKDANDITKLNKKD